MTKMVRVFEYMNFFINLGLLFSSDSPDLKVHAWIDASYAVHDDAKGHSGTIISIGCTPSSHECTVYVKSRKQMLVWCLHTISGLGTLHTLLCVTLTQQALPLRFMLD